MRTTWPSCKCGKKKAEPSAPQPVVSDESANSSYDEGTSRGADDAAVTDADRERFLNEIIYFAFDSAVIDDAGRAIADSKAAYLKNNPQTSVVLEGHCDARGTAEYNIALGERRATAVKNLLVDLGADGSKLTTISYGKERLADPTDHAKNRRVVCVIE